jgi:tripartite ATP-independent transporter DctM subunit
MSTTTAALVGIALFVVLMLLRMPVSIAMLLTGFVGSLYVLSPRAAFQLISADLWGTFSSYGLSVIPMFVLMGQIAFASGMTERLYRAAYQWVGHLPGGIAATTILASMGFATVSGSNSATTATMGAVALPEMRRYGYSKALSGGSVAIGGTLGVVIPPSVVLIVIAIQTEQSIGRLFVAAVVPGVLLTVLLLLTVIVLCRLNPVLGPPGPGATLRERVVSLGGVVEALVLFSLVIGGLYAGWFTPTEAGAVGAFGAFLIALLRGKLSLHVLRQSALDTIRISAMVVLLIAGAVVFGRFLTVTRLPFRLAGWAADLDISPTYILLLILFIYLVGGLIMDALGFLVATIPIFFPLALVLGYDPIWYTVVITLVTTVGAVTPPVGVNVYIVSALDPDLDITTIFRGIAPFLLVYVVVIGLLLFVPDLALFLGRR